MNFTRRGCLQAMSRGLAAGFAAGGAKGFALGAQSVSKADSSKLGMPGLYPGRVCAVENPAVHRFRPVPSRAGSKDDAAGHDGVDRRRRLGGRLAAIL